MAATPPSRSTSPNPVDVLVDESDPSRRSQAHKTLGLRAKESGNMPMAEFHLREALDLDPTDEDTAEVLRTMGREPNPTPPPAVRRRSSIPDFVGRLLGRHR